MKFDLRHLQQIEALHRHRNFARAAKELNISQPGLSQSIRLLENQLGYKLFDRNAREVSPTAFGRRALELGRSILRDSEHLERELKMLADLDTGLIRIGIGPLAAEILLGRTLGRMAADYPGFTVRTKVEWVPALLEGLSNGELDILVCDTRFVTNHEELDFIDLPQYTACFVCRPGHPLAGCEKVSFRDIFDYPIATPKLPRIITLALARLSGLNFRTMDEFPNGLVEAPYHLLTETIMRCDAVGIGINPIFQRGLEDGDLQLLPLHNPELTTQYELVSLKRYSLSPAVQVLQKYVIETCRELAKASGLISR
jgi:DNA-binding transcriptional LysR family regulator